MADSYRVTADGSGLDFVAAMSMAIGEFNAELDAEMQEAMHEGGKVARSHLRGNSPKMTGDYSRSWGCDYEDRDGHHEAIVKNRDHYQLTHLLEDGHDIKNRKDGPILGHVNPAKPERHIEAAAEEGRRAFERKLGVKL